MAEVEWPEQVLHVQFSRVVLDRPGGEGVTEAVGIGVDTGPHAQALEERPQEVRVHRAPRLRPPRDGEEEGPGGRPAEAVDVVPQGAGGPVAERHDALFAPLAVADMDAAGLPVDILQGEAVELGVAQAGVEEEENDRPVAAAELRRWGRRPSSSAWISPSVSGWITFCSTLTLGIPAKGFRAV